MSIDARTTPSPLLLYRGNAEARATRLPAGTKEQTTLSLSQTKKRLRQTMRHKRRALSAQTVQQAGRDFANKLKNTPAFMRAKRIGFYQAIDNEVDMSASIALALSMGKTVAIPLVHPLYSRRMVFKQLTKNGRLHSGFANILEPALSDVDIPRWSLDCVITPLLACDKMGRRLGQGGGFYDRAFSAQQGKQHGRQPTLIGAAYDFQCVNHLDVDAWDRTLNLLLVVDS